MSKNFFNSSHLLIGSIDRCKHLCCHEGVDKPPKAPKQTTAAPIAESCSKAVAKNHSKPNAIRTKLDMATAEARKSKKDIETVDLAHKRDPDEYAKVAPRAYRSLHQLHEKVNKDNKRPSIANITPSFSYKKGEQPKFTFLGASANTGKEHEEPSSDYGTIWMDELPSPSALLRRDDPVQGGLASDDIDFAESLPEYFETASVPDGLGDDDGGYAKDAAMRNTNATDAGSTDHGEVEKAVDGPTSEEGLEVSQYFKGAEASAKVSSHDKLFMSTDSPQKASSPGLKRKTAGSLGAGYNEADSLPEGKKAKIDTVSGSPGVQPSLGKEEQDAIKAGHPAWVYEFDPAFIAEWEPYVEFV